MGIGLMALVLAAAQSNDGVPPVMVDMVPPAQIEGAPLRQPEGGGWSCSSGYGDCLRIDRGEDGTAGLGVFDMDAAATAIAATPLPAAIATDVDGAEISVWDRAIRLRNPATASGDARVYLIGIIRLRRVGYSGGGAGAERLHLFPLTIAGGDAALGPEIVSLPWASSAMIRACFDERDAQHRRGACHDQYEFTPTLALAGGEPANGAWPDLTYATTATAYPRTARQDRDSADQPPLTQADLTLWRDPECSYTRTLRHNPATERYEMDRPAPDCSDYTVP